VDQADAVLVVPEVATVEVLGKALLELRVRILAAHHQVAAALALHPNR
jgi:hypothetical protein